MLLGYSAGVNLDFYLIHDLATKATTVSSVWYPRLFFLFSL